MTHNECISVTAHVTAAMRAMEFPKKTSIRAVVNSRESLVKEAMLQVGADLSMGSLIKNPGGTIVTGGGYVAGKAHLVAAAQARLTAPGVGLDAGSVSGDTLRLMMQGIVDTIASVRLIRHTAD